MNTNNCWLPLNPQAIPINQDNIIIDGFYFKYKKPFKLNFG